MTHTQLLAFSPSASVFLVVFGAACVVTGLMIVKSQPSAWVLGVISALIGVVAVLLGLT
jgi:hypothetical protein